ncbi:MAG: HD domain-containing protein [Solirubrobacterales bacterium]
MEPRWLDELKRWFSAYTNRFFGQDEYVNMHLRIKQEHTRRTCEEMLHLAGRLALDANQTRIAETIAMLHDVGRFPQFSMYRTYSDVRSVSHGALGVEVLDREGVLEDLTAEERQWVRTAIANHSQKDLPSGLDDRTLLFLKMIRDADKLDIFRIALDVYRRRKENSQGVSFEIELPDEPRISPKVLEAVLAGQPIEYASLRTLNDIRLCQIGWVYDLNFTASVERFHACNYLNELLGYLPQTPDIAEVDRRIRQHIDTRLASQL